MQLKQHKPILSSAFQLLILIAGFVITACTGKSEALRPARKILLVQSGDKGEPYTKASTELLKKKLKEEDFNLDLKRVCLGYPNTIQKRLGIGLRHYVNDTLNGWKPELIIINDEQALNSVLDSIEFGSDIKSLFTHTPVVFGGVSNFSHERLLLLPNFTGFTTNLYLKENLQFIHNVTGDWNVYTELDNTPTDSLLRLRIADDLKNSAYIFNDKWEIAQPEEENVRKLHPGQMVLTPASSINYELNSADKDHEKGKAKMEWMLAHAIRHNHLQVKYDMNSEVFSDRAIMPQFTCINKLFDDPRRTFYLGGYFVTVEQQMSDIADYASKILNGYELSSLPIQEHKATYNMDWKAMKIRGMRYSDWKDKFHIINAPYYVRHFTTTFISFVLVCFFLAFCAVAMVYIYIRLKDRSMAKRLKAIKAIQAEKNDAIRSANANFWHIENDVISFTFPNNATISHPIEIYLKKLVAPESEKIVRDHIYGNMTKVGVNRCRAMVRQSKAMNRYNWYELRYFASEEDIKQKIFNGIAVLIDDQKASEDQLLQAQEQSEKASVKETFIANMSHDIRTPLNSIVGFTQILSDTSVELPEESQREFAQLIHMNSEILLKLIQDTIDVTNMQVGKFKFHPNIVTANSIVEMAYRSNQILKPANLDFLKQLTEEWVEVNIDVNRTQQVINNFLSNAFKFTTNGHITVGCKLIQNNEYVEFFVEDSGVGISKEQLEHLFDRYYKTDEHHKGTGLGLNISKEIVEQQGGAITAESKEGEGSCFKAIFPVHVKEGGME